MLSKTIRIELPKPLDRMSSRENKKYAKAMNEIAHAAFENDEITVLKLLLKYGLKLA